MQDSPAALFDPNRAGAAQLNITSVVDPYDTSGSPLVNAGSIEATFTATFTGATISGSFSSGVCDTIVNI